MFTFILLNVDLLKETIRVLEYPWEKEIRLPALRA